MDMNMGIYPSMFLGMYGACVCRFYMLNHVLIMFSLILLSFTLFTFDAVWNLYRIGSSMTLLLVAVTFKLSVAGTLPTISYLTYLDVSCFYMNIPGFRSLRICADLQDFCRSLQICADWKKNCHTQKRNKNPTGMSNE